MANDSTRNMDRRTFLKQGALGLGAVMATTHARTAFATDGQSTRGRLNGSIFLTPKRLSDRLYRLAEVGKSGAWGRELVSLGSRLEDYIDTSGMSEAMKYAHAVRVCAEKAPLRVLPDQLLVGSATIREASLHTVPLINISSVSHTTLGWHRVLAEGWQGTRARIESRLRRGGLDEAGQDLLRSMLVCLDAGALFHKRYMDRLGELIAASSGEQRAHYERVRDRLRHVPERPPQTFGEAIQSLWFQYAFQRLIGTWSGLGRIDWYLGPYLTADLAAKRITLDEARELVAAFWIQGTEWTGAHDFGGSGDAQFYQNVVLGGVDPQGREVTNELTYLILDVVEELHISDYPIAVRLNAKSPERLLRRMAEVQRHGGGIVAAYNEDVVIEALVRFGYPLEEARSFANDGCWEALIPGKTHFGYYPFDLLQRLQDVLALNSNSSPVPHYETFEDLYAAFRKSMEAQIDGVMRLCDGHGRSSVPSVMVSMYVDDCIDRGREYWNRGPVYTVLAPHAGGMANVANGLLAIRKVVYEEKRMSLSEYVQILRNDWKDHEELRLSVLNRVPFYGNDDDEADAMVKRVFDDYTAYCARTREREGVLRPAGISTFGREIAWLPERTASADGHHRGEYLATNFSPSPGTDRQGPTAALNSYCKMDFTKLPNIGTLELKVLPDSVRGEEGVRALMGLLRSFVRMGGCFVHVDVVDTAVLRDAQEHPERYSTLAVRISGWSARFVTLNKQWQDMLINRTQQVV